MKSAANDASKVSTLRCAIYTRKSSEEGLEQGFNSLDAQRESCAAFIQSQKTLGWVPSSTLYDDGGYSGGNMERPGLKLLLADIAAKRIKVVVVYKVDRLTRSLADFAKLVELFDSHGVSFVSVTQQFNTTSSMGRLTLNVLLSFAQFEREVTGERIRDKIAASKRKGMWMGGLPPMGYAPRERTLSIIEDQAIQIREIFNLYLEFGCVRTLKVELDRRRWITPERQTKRPGAAGRRPFSRGHLYRILSNPIYIGQISHKGEVFEGNHLPLVDREVWHAVQDQLESNRQGVKGRVNAINPSLLAGLLVDDSGQKLTPTHTKRNSRRYRYYVSGDLHEGTATKQTGFRIPAYELETAVTDCIVSFLEDEALVLDWIEQQQVEGAALKDGAPLNVKDGLSAAKAAAELLADGGRKHLAQMVERIVVHANRLEVAIKGHLLGGYKESIHLALPIELKRRGMAMRLVVNNNTQARGPDKKLLELIAKGHQWLARLTSGRCEGVGVIGANEKISSSYVTRVIYLAFLAPDIIEAIARGLHPADLNTEKLMRMVPLPEDWGEQRRLLKMDG